MIHFVYIYGGGHIIIVDRIVLIFVVRNFNFIKVFDKTKWQRLFNNKMCIVILNYYV